MQLFVLIVGEAYDSDQTLGVYSTKEKAIAAGQEYSKSWEEWRMLDGRLSVWSCTLDDKAGMLVPLTRTF